MTKEDIINDIEKSARSALFAIESTNIFTHLTKIYSKMKNIENICLQDNITEGDLFTISCEAAFIEDHIYKLSELHYNVSAPNSRIEKAIKEYKDSVKDV